MDSNGIKQNIVAGAFTASAHGGDSFLAVSSFTTAHQQPTDKTGTKATSRVAFCVPYIKGNFASLHYFAGNIPMYALLMQLKKATPTGVIKNIKKFLRENKFAVSYPTALKYLRQLQAQGFVWSDNKNLYLKSYDEITELCGGVAKHGHFYVDAKNDLKQSLEAMILKSSQNRQLYKVHEATEKSSKEKITKLSPNGLIVCEQRREDDVFLTCQGFASKLYRKSKLTGHRHFRKLERSGLIRRTPRFIKTEIGDKQKSRYLYGELYHIIPYAVEVLMETDCRKRLQKPTGKMSVDDYIACRYTGEFD